MFLKSQFELKQELKAAQEDRRILAKQLRDERQLSSELFDIIFELNSKVAHLEYDLWAATSPELVQINHPELTLVEEFPDGTEREVVGEERDYLLEAYNRLLEDRYEDDW